MQVTGLVLQLQLKLKSYFCWLTESQFFPQRPQDGSELPKPCEVLVSMPQNRHHLLASLNLDGNLYLLPLLKIKVNLAKLLNKSQVQLPKPLPFHQRLFKTMTSFMPLVTVLSTRATNNI